ncbi:MAG: hypothetical protein FJ298_13075 [Planctomycetes bacterium]|nr:hypothetical protein [Planctomycetota bacterium]
MASTSRALESESTRLEHAQRAGAADLGRRTARALLSGATPREVLARLMAGDPLGLRARVAAALANEALFLDSDRALLRASAHVARFAPRYRGQPEPEAWLAARVLAAVRELADEEHEGVGREGVGQAAGVGQEAALPAPLCELAAKLKLDPLALARACAALNACERVERRAFRALVIEARELDVAARDIGSTPSETGRAARRAIDAALGALERGGAA